MHCFKDAEGRDWLVRVTVDAVARVKARLNVYLPGLLAGGPVSLDELLADVCRLVDVLYVLCEEQCTQRGMSDRDFGRGLGGDAVEAAAEALAEALIDFFPRSRRGPLRALLAKMRDAERTELARMQEKISALDPASPETWKGLSPGPSGSTPASSASTPGPSP